MKETGLSKPDQIEAAAAACPDVSVVVNNAGAFTGRLLIGADVCTGLAEADPAAEIVIMGRPELTRLYLAALDEAGRTAREVDGERAFLAGIQALVKEIA